MLPIYMNPSFSLASLTFSVKLVLRSINLLIVVERKLASNRQCVIWYCLNFAFENPVYSYSFFPAKLDWLHPCEGPLKIKGLKVSAHEHVFNSVAQLVHTLINLLAEALRHHL